MTLLPRTIAGLPPRQGAAFLGLFFFPSVVQATLLTVLPLGALRLLGTAQAVTLLYAATGLAAVIGRFCIPFLVHLLDRRRVFTLGALALAASSLLFASDLLPAFAAGLVLNTVGVACLDITSQLYLLDHAPRQALRHFEPTRIFAAAAPWTFGPWFGVHLQQTVAFAAPFAVVIAAAGALLLLFRALGLSEQPATAARRAATNPLTYLPRFFSQPRLLLAWTLASARSSWWSMFFVYAPILAVTSGLSPETGGLVVSIGTGWTWIVPLWGWVGRRFGLRALMRTGYAAAGACSIAAALAAGQPWLGALFLIAAAFSAGALDGAGNLLFLRAVHPYERAEMTTVFASFRDVTQVVPPATCSLLLAFFALPSVFVASGVMMLAAAALASRIPRRL
jgi:MFS family permease